MAYLVKEKKLNRASGKKETHYRIGERIGGRQKTHVLGFVSKKEAERLLKMHEGQRAAAGPPPKTVPGSKAVGDYLEDRLLPHVQESGLAKKSITSCEGSVKHLKRLLTGDVSEVSRASFDAYVTARRGEGMRGRTIQIERGWLLKALRLALEDGLVDALPELRRPNRSDSRGHVHLDAEASTRLLEALPWQKDFPSALAVYVSLEMGLRSGELLSRRWEDVRWRQGNNGALYVGPRLDAAGELVWETKSRKARTVPLTAGVHAVLHAWWGREENPETGWIFPGRGTDKARGTFRGALKSACKRAGVTVVHQHALRHTWATRMAVQGIPRAVTQALGGWTSPRVLEEVYQHSTSELESQALERSSLPAPSGAPRKPTE